MTQYNSVNVILSNLKLNKLKSGIKSGPKEPNSNDKTNFQYQLLLSDRQVSRFCKTFVNNSSANIKLSKTLLL